MLVDKDNDIISVLGYKKSEKINLDTKYDLLIQFINIFVNLQNTLIQQKISLKIKNQLNSLIFQKILKILCICKINIDIILFKC